MSNGSTLLLGLEGIVVDTVGLDGDGVRVVRVGTADEWVGRCPQCRARSSRSRGWVTTRPRDIKIGPDRPRIEWRKLTVMSHSPLEIPSQILGVLIGSLQGVHRR